MLKLLPSLVYVQEIGFKSLFYYNANWVAFRQGIISHPNDRLLVLRYYIKQCFFLYFRLPHTLARLDLKGNSIQRIKEQELKNLRHLQVLNLRNNNISTIDHSLWKYLPRLRYLYLDSNPWNCTCEFLKTRRVLTAKGIDVKGGKCKAPSESQGESWMSSRKVLHLCAHNNLYSLEEGEEIGKNTSVDNPSSLRVNMDDYYDYEIY